MLGYNYNHAKLIFFVEADGAKEIGCVEQAHKRRLLLLYPASPCYHSSSDCWMGSH